MDVINSNYRFEHSDIEKGFIQGISVGCMAAARSQPTAIPRRHLKALRDLRKGGDLAIVPADKGGGLVLLDKVDYDRKVLELLDCRDTYDKCDSKTWRKMSLDFSRKARKIMTSCRGGKSLLRLLESAPNCPFLRVTVKTHKDGYPARPITNSRGAANHRLSAELSSYLTLAVGKISG